MKKYRFLTIATVLLILFFSREKPIAAIQDNQRPNIIVIMSDDMGYSDIGCYGGDVNTPNKPNTIAIEPSTGVSDSFNNKIGLQVLNAEENYSIDWTIKLDNNEE